MFLSHIIYFGLVLAQYFTRPKTRQKKDMEFPVFSIVALFLLFFTEFSGSSNGVIEANECGTGFHSDSECQLGKRG